MNRKLRITSIIYAATGLLSFNASAQIDTIGEGKTKLLTSLLKPGLRQYIIYMLDPAKPKTISFWYWSRNIKREVRAGENVITTIQSWLGGDTIAYRNFYSTNRSSDFLPLFHSETVRGKVKAYNWSGSKLTGADTVAGNTAEKFDLKFDNPNYNWNLDIETLEQLPLAAGKTFAINFYDAGLDPPSYIPYKVSGTEVLKSYDNQSIDCWILSTEGTIPNRGKYSERYWISKNGHEFIKEEDTYPGGYRYKVKISGFLPDLLKTFNR